MKLLFHKMILENYRVFYGRQEIEFYSRGSTDQNLVLVGGLNGAGKTSLLNAFNILLFGPHLLGQQEYNHVLNSSLNNLHFAEGGRNCSIELHLGDSMPFKIRMKIYFNEQQMYTMHERTVISRGRISNLTDTEYQRFVERVIPVEVAPFFIFDGEKIQRLVERQENGELKSAIQNIISLDLYKSALSHAKSAQQKLLENVRKHTTNENLDEIAGRINSEAQEIDDIKLRVESYQREISNMESEREAFRDSMIRKQKEGSGSHSRLSANIALAHRDLDEISKNIESLKQMIPLYLLEPLISDLKTRISNEQKYLSAKKQQQLAFRDFDKFISELQKQIETSNGAWNINSDVYQVIKRTWAKIFNLSVKEELNDNLTVLHDLSRGDILSILSFKPTSVMEISSLIEKRYQVENRLVALMEKQKSLPDAPDVSQEEDKVRELSENIGVLIAKKRTAEKKLQNVEESYRKLQRKYNELAEKSSMAPELVRVAKFGGQVLKVMETFIEQVTDAKAHQIADEFSLIIQRILRKEKEFHKIEFDPGTFMIKIYNEHGRPVRLSDRSAGEKQLIAFALIWALTKCANTSLPFVIDTPLGRLDSIHRESLARYYFPNLSKQVIILSTDTEVNDRYLTPMKKNVFRQYRLEYDSTKKITEIMSGYFK